MYSYTTTGRRLSPIFVRKACLTTAVLVAALAMVVGMIWHQMSWIPCFAAVIVAIVWTLTAVFDYQRASNGAAYWFSSDRDRKWLSFVLAITFTAPLSLMFVGSPTYGVRINVDTGTTSIEKSVMIAVPVLHNVVFTTDDYRPKVTVQITTLDDIPLLCTVSVSGIVFDRRNNLALTSFLLDLARVGNPADYIDAQLQDALRLAAVAVFSKRTTAQIEQERRFVIPYNIGTPVGDVFNRLHLQWQAGEASASCSVAFSN